ncbi:hypothetical protein G9A89_016619 [Geosiphon pyriformis]|nr:hypothetical protein G9A89_016619 [Geosiphon pyriformis]
MSIITGAHISKKLGAIFSQKDENSRKHAIVYASKSLTPAEKNYSVTEQEKTLLNTLKSVISVKKNKPNWKEDIHLISVGQPFDRIGIDVVGPLTIILDDNRYIITATKYLIK